MESNKKLSFLSISVLISLAFSFFNFLPAQAETLEEILDEIARIEAQLQDLRDQLKLPSSCVGITLQRSLKEGISGTDVKCLQAILNTDSATQVALSGPGSFGKESTYFGSLTTLALIKFQEKYATEILIPLGLTTGTGFAGPKTIAKLNTLLNPSSPESTAPDAPTVSLGSNFSSIAPGWPLNLNWASSNTTNCSGTNFPTNQATNGSVSVAPRQTTTYFISCESPQGSTWADVTVIVSSGAGTSSIGGGETGVGVESPVPSSAPSAPSSDAAPAPPSDSSAPSELGCFLAGTKITTADGTLKSIEDVNAGDLVQYYDFKAKTIRTTKVTKTYIYSPEKMSADFYLVINNKLRVTPSQPLDSPENRMILAGDLKIGDKLQGENGIITVSSIDRVQQRATTYYIETESGHYFVDGFSDQLKVFKAIDNLFASLVNVISRLVRVIEDMK